MNEKELLNVKVIVYTLLSALVVLAGSRDREIECDHNDNERTACEGNES